MEKIRRRIIFHGIVQGVGFRYNMYYAAQTFGVSGWVKNNCDGTVTAELEGTEADIDSTIMQVERARFVQIENIETKTLMTQNSHSFEIK